MSVRRYSQALGCNRVDALARRHDNLRVLDPKRVGVGVQRGLRACRLLGALTLAALLSFGTRSAVAEPPSALPAPAPSATPATGASVPLLAFVFGAIGLSGISVAGTTGFLALNQKAIAEDHCSSTVQLCDARGRDANDMGRTLRDISTAGFIVGGVGLGLSAYFLLTAPAHDGVLDVAVAVDGSRPQAALVAHF